MRPKFQPLFAPAEAFLSSGGPAAPAAPAATPAAPAAAAAAVVPAVPVAAPAATPTAAAVTGFMAPHLNPDGSFKATMIDAFKNNPDYAELAPTVQKYTNEADFLKGMVHLTKMAGHKVDGVLVPRAEGAKPEEVSAYRAAIGVPATPEGYQLKPDTMPEGIGWDESSEAEVKELAKWAYDKHIPQDTAKEMVLKMHEKMSTFAKGAVAAVDLFVAENGAKCDAYMKKEHGDNAAARHARLVAYLPVLDAGFDPNTPEGKVILSHPGVIRLIDFHFTQVMGNTALPGVKGASGAPGGGRDPRTEAKELMRLHPNPDKATQDKINALYVEDAANQKKAAAAAGRR